MADILYPSIPDPTNDPKSLMTTVLALRDTVRLLVRDLTAVKQNVSENAVAPIAHVSGFSAGSTITGNLTLAAKTDVLFIAAFTTGVAIASNSGNLILTIDGVDNIVCAIPWSYAAALPVTGLLVVPHMSAGKHTVSVRATFGAGVLNGVAFCGFGFVA